MKKQLLFISFILTILSIVIYFLGKFVLGYTDAIQQKKSKFMCYYYSCNQWLKNKNKGILLEKFFNDNGYHTIAVYGMGELGLRFCEEMKNSEIYIKYTMDHCRISYENIPSKTLADTLEDVDAIIVTAIYDFDSIYDKITAIKPNTPLISLEKILLELA